MSIDVLFDPSSLCIKHLENKKKDRFLEKPDALEQSNVYQRENNKNKTNIIGG